MGFHFSEKETVYCLLGLIPNNIACYDQTEQFVCIECSFSVSVNVVLEAEVPLLDSTDNL